MLNVGSEFLKGTIMTKSQTIQLHEAQVQSRNKFSLLEMSTEGCSHMWPENQKATKLSAATKRHILYYGNIF